jgi:hypothetical protein
MTAGWSSNSRVNVCLVRRRAFLQLVGAASLAPAALDADAPSPAAIVLYGDRAVPLAAVRRDPKDPSALWVRARDLPRINDFEIKPEGACRLDLCVPISKDMRRGDYFNLTAFAGKVRQATVADTSARVWSFGEIQALGGSFRDGRVAPDVTVPDRKGRPVRLSSFRGKKVLLVTWASW